MTKEETLQRLKGQLIVSCQAYEDNPLYGTEHMVTMAKCVLAGGAEGIRACWPENVKAIRELTDVALIGINKIMPAAGTDFYDSVFITPTYEAAVAVIEAGCDVVALDGTLRGRSEEALIALVKRLKEAYPNIVLMADLATIEEGIICERAGFDILSSTLSGYTRETMHKPADGPDLKLIQELKRRTDCLVNGEGKIWDSKQLREVWAAGADMVTMGSAITNPMKTTAYLIDQMRK